MAEYLNGQLDDEDVAELVQWTGWHDMIADGRDAWEYEGDLILPARSALELIRDNLAPDQVAVLDEFDRVAHADPAAFNAFFEYDHARREPATDLEDAGVEGVRVPASHWWWRPLAV